MRHFQTALLSAALALCLAGCTGGEETTAQPTATPSAAPTATATATPTPEPTTNPLTGQESTATGLRPVAVALRTGEGTTPQWGVASADVLIEGVTEGKTAGLTAVFSHPDQISKVGPVGPGRDLMLQLVLPINAVPVHIDKNIYASNLLNLLSYQDLDGLHIGTAAFAFDQGRYESGFREENCWYTTGDLIQAGLDSYGTDAQGVTMPLFSFGERPAPATRNATELTITFSDSDVEQLVYSPDIGLYLKNNPDGSAQMDADSGDQAAFTNVFVLYASSGIKDDGITRQYDLSGGTGIYLTGGGWEQIQWTKGDATAPLSLTDMSGKTLTVSPGKSFIAVWGGYYGQGLRLVGEDGTEQALPQKPALLESGIPDEVAQAAEEAIRTQQAIEEAQAQLTAAQEALAQAQQAESEALANDNPDDDDPARQATADAQAAVDAAQQALNSLQPPSEEASAEAPAESQAESPTESQAESQAAASEPAESQPTESQAASEQTNG